MPEGPVCVRFCATCRTCGPVRQPSVEDLKAQKYTQSLTIILHLIYRYSLILHLPVKHQDWSDLESSHSTQQHLAVHTLRKGGSGNNEINVCFFNKTSKFNFRLIFICWADAQDEDPDIILRYYCKSP